jgi:hypothetical protein
MANAVRRLPDSAETILRLSVACVVTLDEPDAVTAFDRSHFGWERYLAAGLTIVDRATGGPADLAELAAEQRASVAALGLALTGPDMPLDRRR